MNLLSDAFLRSSLLALAVALVAFGLAAFLLIRGLRRGGRGVLVSTVVSAVLVTVGGLILVQEIRMLSHRLPQMLRADERVGQPLPAFEYDRVLDASTGRLDDLRGQVVLVNVWATWCIPCRQETPILERLQETYADRGLVVVHLSDEPIEEVAAYLEKSPSATLHVRADRLPWKVGSRPTSYVLDREGVVRRSLPGARTFEHFEGAIKAFL